MGLTLVTGGARSGKSVYAEKRIAEWEAAGVGPVTYIATAIPFADGMKDRIAKHQARRPEHWMTIERYRDFKAMAEDPAFVQSRTVLLDCLTVLITNQMLAMETDWERVSMERVDAVEAAITADVNDALDLLAAKRSVIVTNEVGMGLVPAYRMGNLFRDIAGRINQMAAARADEVIFCVSGIPMRIK